MDKNIVEAIVAVCTMAAALAPLYLIMWRTGVDAKQARLHSSAANDAVNRTHANTPRLADNVLRLLERSEKHDSAIDAMQDELVVIRSCCSATTKLLENVSLKCPMMKEDDREAGE